MEDVLSESSIGDCVVFHNDSLHRGGSHRGISGDLLVVVPQTF